MSFSIAGKTAIVTGAAHGVGLAVARHFADQGANVVFADMNEEALLHEVGEETEKEDSNVRIFAGDLRQKLTLANLLSATNDAFDGVDILVNASRQITCSDPLDPDEDAVETLIQQNLMASLRLTQHVARRMIKQADDDGRADGQNGAIINIRSLGVGRTQPELLGYSISCAALDQMTRSMALALAPHRIRVNGVAFGSVMSASLKDALKTDDVQRDAIIAGTPLGRIAKASEVAETARYLASDGSAFMTGQIVTVDGGRTLMDNIGVPIH